MLSLFIKYKIVLINAVYLPFLWTSEENGQKHLTGKEGEKPLTKQWKRD